MTLLGLLALFGAILCIVALFFLVLVTSDAIRRHRHPGYIPWAEPKRKP